MKFGRSVRYANQRLDDSPGAGALLAYFLAQRKEAPASPVANTNTGKTPLSNLIFG